MTSESRILLIFAVFAATMLIGTFGFIIYNGGSPRLIRLQQMQDDLAEKNRLALHPETAEMIGFERVTTAPNDALITFEAFLDGKGICSSLEPEFRSVCTIRVYSTAEGGSLLVRIAKCSDERTRNCLLCTDKNGKPLEFQDVRAVDSDGNMIDFLGYRRVLPERGWIQNEKPLKFTGRVTVVNGTGRIISPIEKIGQIN